MSRSTSNTFGPPPAGAKSSLSRSKTVMIGAKKPMLRKLGSCIRGGRIRVFSPFPDGGTNVVSNRERAWTPAGLYITALDAVLVRFLPGLVEGLECFWIENLFRHRLSF